MFVSRNNYGDDYSYVVTMNYPLKVTSESQSGETGVIWRDPRDPYILIKKFALFELAEGIQLLPGEGPIHFLLSRVEEVGQEVVSRKEKND